MLANKKGGYLALGERGFTHMQGLFFFDAEEFAPYKVLENIWLDGKMSGIKNGFATAGRLYDEGAEEEFTIVNNAMIYSVKGYSGDLMLDLDFRHIFDYNTEGRIYTLSQVGDELIVKYEKFNNNALSGLLRARYLVVKGVPGHRDINSWEQKHYDYDARRGSQSEFYT